MTVSTPEYAALAAAVYRVNVNPEQHLPEPNGWQELTRAEFSSGFEVATYRKANQVVVAFAGTTDIEDWSLANAPLVIGVFSPQLTEAMCYLKGVQAAMASEPGLEFTLTGHSLGGGLAALAATFFDMSATCFDAAPFSQSLLSTSVYGTVGAALALAGVQDAAFNSYYPGRSANISNFAIAGEALSLLPEFMRIGPDTTFYGTDPAMSDPVARHSMALLAATLGVPDLEQLLMSLPGVGLSLLGYVEYGGQPPAVPLVASLLADELVKSQGVPSALDALVADLNNVRTAKVLGSISDTAARLYSAYAMAAYYAHGLSAVTAGVFESSAGSLAIKVEYFNQQMLEEAIAATFAIGDDSVAASLGQLADANDALWGETVRDLLSEGGLPGVDTSNLSPIDSDETGLPATYWHDRAYFAKQIALGRLHASDPVEVDGRTLLFAEGGTASAGWAIDAVYGTKGDDTLEGTVFRDALYGARGADELLGGGGDDSLSGGEGNDRLDGGSGADKLYGGADHDTCVIDNAGDQIFEDADKGFDTVEIHAGALVAGGYILGANVEKALLDNDADIANLTGNAQGNYLVGNSSSNTLDGGAGFDILEGGGGDDLYVLHDQSGVNGEPDDVVELSGDGNDTVLAYFSGHTLDANVENLVIAAVPDGTAVTGYGNGSDNAIQLADAAATYGVTLYGYGGNDNLVGAAGDDYLAGGAGNDSLTGNDGADNFHGGSGTDTLNGGNGNDTLTTFGNASALHGGSGLDTLRTMGSSAVAHGGAGDDYLWNQGFNNVLYGDAGSDYISDMGFNATFGWTSGDGMDSVGRAGNGSKFRFEGSSISSLQATRVGTNLQVSTEDGEGATFQGWFSGQSRMSIEAPDGTVWTPDAVDSNFTSGVYQVAYSSGVHTANEFASVIASYVPIVAYSFNEPSQVYISETSSADISNAWNQALQYGTTHVDSASGRLYQSWSLPVQSMASAFGTLLPNGHRGNETFSANGTVNFDIWQAPGGNYEFAITDASWQKTHTQGWFSMGDEYTPFGAYIQQSWSLGSWSRGHSSRVVTTLEAPTDSFELFGSAAARSIALYSDSSSEVHDDSTTNTSWANVASDYDASVQAMPIVEFAPLLSTGSVDAFDAGVSPVSTGYMGSVAALPGLRPIEDTWVTTGYRDTSMMLLPELQAA